MIQVSQVLNILFKVHWKDLRIFANALSFYIYVTPFLNPSPRERDFVGSKTLLKWCFALAKLELNIHELDFAVFEMPQAAETARFYELGVVIEFVPDSFRVVSV